MTNTTAVLGTGTMGAGMARSCLRAGLTTRVWNRTTEKATPLADDGAGVADSVLDAVQGADVVVVMLFDADAVASVLPDVAAGAPDAVVLQCSTVGPTAARRLSAQASDLGLTLVDAPVLGTKEPAEQGKLVVLLAGDPDAIGRARPVLDAVGSRTVNAGVEPGAASALKLACNSWVSGITALAGQAVRLAQASGLDPRLVLEAFRGGPADSPYLQAKAGQMIDGEFTPPSFSVHGVTKDVSLMLEQAALVGVSPALLQAVHDRYVTAADAGHADADMAAVISAF